MQNSFYKRYEKSLDDRNAVILVDKLKSLYTQNQDNQLNFFYTIYEFKTLRTSLGFSDLLLKGVSKNVIKKSDLLYEMFGISKGTYSKICRVCERFVQLKYVQDSDIPVPIYKNLICNFNSSKIFELLALSDEVLESAIISKRINYTMTVKELRKAIKDIINGTSPVEEEKDTIPTEESDVPEYVKVSDKKYTASDLKKYKKDELINMYLDLQMAYLKIKEKR